MPNPFASSVVVGSVIGSVFGSDSGGGLSDETFASIKRKARTAARRATRQEFRRLEKQAAAERREQQGGGIGRGGSVSPPRGRVSQAERARVKREVDKDILEQIVGRQNLPVPVRGDPRIPPPATRQVFEDIGDAVIRTSGDILGAVATVGGAALAAILAAIGSGGTGGTGEPPFFPPVPVPDSGDGGSVLPPPVPPFTGREEIGPPLPPGELQTPGRETPQLEPVVVSASRRALPRGTLEEISVGASRRAPPAPSPPAITLPRLPAILSSPILQLGLLAGISSLGRSQPRSAQLQITQNLPRPAVPTPAPVPQPLPFAGGSLAPPGRPTDTRTDNCEKRRRKNRKTCRAGFFRETRSRTRFTTWTKFDCATGKIIEEK